MAEQREMLRAMTNSERDPKLKIGKENQIAEFDRQQVKKG
jgi:hypothetical protein